MICPSLGGTTVAVGLKVEVEVGFGVIVAVDIGVWVGAGIAVGIDIWVGGTGVAVVDIGMLVGIGVMVGVGVGVGKKLARRRGRPARVHINNTRVMPTRNKAVNGLGIEAGRRTGDLAVEGVNGWPWGSGGMGTAGWTGGTASVALPPST